MNGIRGKMATQAGHAYVHAFWDATIPDANHTMIAEPEVFEQKKEQALAYAHGEHAYKITLIVDTVDELKALQEAYRNVCGTSLVTDAGFTEPTRWESVGKPRHARHAWAQAQKPTRWESVGKPRHYR